MDRLTAAQAGAQFEGMLLQQMLSPLERSLGQGGSIVMAPLAQSIAAHDTGGFGSVLAALFEKHDAT
ncbi:MAG: hypothetical protein GIW97_06250 [Candidatus Eremiobacteraeota bacterium]|nr:hypothetical protein [Candidatus Eremiobacteraeota bacterium]